MAVELGTAQFILVFNLVIIVFIAGCLLREFCYIESPLLGSSLPKQEYYSVFKNMR